MSGGAGRAILGRLVQSAIVLLILSFCVYGLIGLMPGDPVDLMIGADPSMTAADVARLKQLQGLDQPLVERYGRWLGAALSGDFGYSRLQARPVIEALPQAALNSIAILAAALSLALAIGWPLGILSALKRGGALDHGLGALTYFALAVPTFWLGLVLIILFTVELPWLPSGGVATIGGDGGIVDRARHLVLPAVTLGVGIGAAHFRYIRASMFDVLAQDFIRTARAKGAGTRRVVLGHALRLSLAPVVTILALDFGALFSGAVITESVFSYPGMGKLLYDAVMGNDYNLALAAVLAAAVVTLAANALADFARLRLDPRGERT